MCSKSDLWALAGVIYDLTNMVRGLSNRFPNPGNTGIQELRYELHKRMIRGEQGPQQFRNPEYPVHHYIEWNLSSIELPRYTEWLDELVKDCSCYEVEERIDIVEALKRIDFVMTNLQTFLEDEVRPQDVLGYDFPEFLYGRIMNLTRRRQGESDGSDDGDDGDDWGDDGHNGGNDGDEESVLSELDDVPFDGGRNGYNVGDDGDDGDDGAEDLEPARNANDEFADFIEEEFEDEIEEDDHEVGQPGIANLSRTLQFTGLDEQAEEDYRAAFGDGTEYDWALEEQERADQEEEGEGRQTELKDVFEPGLLQEKMLTEKDQAIREKDIPERLQLAREPFPDDADLSPDTVKQRLAEEAVWISELLFPKKGMVSAA